MARPCKSTKVLSDKSQTIDEIAARTEIENRIKGSGLPKPPAWLTPDQKKVFKTIVNMLRDADILSLKDVFVLTTCAIAIDRLNDLEQQINRSPEKLKYPTMMQAKDKYTKDFFRCCNELCLSPQSRAKIANISTAKSELDPLREALRDD